jgi:hypothetical protein
MRFLSIYKTVERGVPPSGEEMNKMGKLIEQGMKAGWLVSTEGCLPSALGARVRLSGGKLSVTDGPFTEAKVGSPSFGPTPRRRQSNWQSNSFPSPVRVNANSANYTRLARKRAARKRRALRRRPPDLAQADRTWCDR